MVNHLLNYNTKTIVQMNTAVAPVAQEKQRAWEGDGEQFTHKREKFLFAFKWSFSFHQYKMKTHHKFIKGHCD